MEHYIGKCYCIKSLTVGDRQSGIVSFLKNHTYDLYQESTGYYWVETGLKNTYHGCRFHTQSIEKVVNLTSFYENFVLLKEYRKLKLEQILKIKN